MGNKAVHAQIYGIVQGVFFRDCTRQKAEELGLTGWVRNCRNGSVESIFYGDSAAVGIMINWLHEGSPASQVDKVVVEEAAPDQALRGFHIRY